MEENTNISLETADCLVRKSAFGHDVIHNICTGTVKSIPWEFGDWGLVALMGLMTFMLLAGIVAIVFMVFSDL